jgi:GMP synthase-like glutamine amidotransferase
MEQPKRLLIIDNSIDAAVYSPVGHWSRHANCDFDAVMPPMGEFPHRIEDYSHVIITGSEASILQDEEWIQAECELVREIASLQIPVLASCFAHQLVVRAISGRGFIRLASTPEFGWTEVVMTAPEGRRDTVCGQLPHAFFSFAAHFDEVFPLPEDWIRLAWSEDCANAIIKWKEGPIWGVQHHPEINIEDGERLLKIIPTMSPGKESLFRKGLRTTKRDSVLSGTLVESFLLNA